MSAQNIIDLFYITHPKKKEQITCVVAFLMTSASFTGSKKILFKNNVSYPSLQRRIIDFLTQKLHTHTL